MTVRMDLMRLTGQDSELTVFGDDLEIVALTGEDRDPEWMDLEPGEMYQRVRAAQATVQRWLAKAKRAHEDNIRRQGAQEILDLWVGASQSEAIYRHKVIPNPALLQELQDLESVSNGPLNSDHPNFLRNKINWASQPGTHYFINAEDDTLVLACCIRPWEAMEQHEHDHIQKNLLVTTLWAKALNIVKSNGWLPSLGSLLNELWKLYGLISSINTRALSLVTVLVAHRLLVLASFTLGQLVIMSVESSEVESRFPWEYLAILDFLSQIAAYSHGLAGA
ncbi:hypothetical protein BXZ70DRAFT_911624 [Cristinia sonorae]|uniref:Uncharacterized protein n=1 Tax=Cristinia sonorae TaxID=1940300 RepID=A0A8K0UCG0_9AGAR|nr:hypothetical protein BXZ70DRAFT_911624 [Cristinia sonorae]